MPITVEATYEKGVLKPHQKLPLQEYDRVWITLEPASDWVARTRGIIRCSDHRIIEWAAMDPDLPYEPMEDL
jgi:predicted DNA-binding antitoxin AbrB/MazE fold protein